MADAAWLDEAARLPADPRASFDRVLRILWYRKWRFILVCAPILLAGLGSLLIVPEQYTAHGTLMVGFRQPELLTAEQARDPIRGEPDIDGAIALMRAYPALRHVVEELNLVAMPEFRVAARQSTPLMIRLRRLGASLLGWTSRTSGEVAHADAVDTVASKLRNELKIERVGRSALLDISYSSPNPALAVDIVNAAARFSSQDESFLSRMTPAERAGFQIVKTSVVAEAVAPPEPSSPNTSLILGMSVLCALAAGFAAVLLKEFRVRQTVVSIEEATRRNSARSRADTGGSHRRASSRCGRRVGRSRSGPCLLRLGDIAASCHLHLAAVTPGRRQNIAAHVRAGCRGQVDDGGGAGYFDGGVWRSGAPARCRSPPPDASPLFRSWTSARLRGMRRLAGFTRACNPPGPDYGSPTSWLPEKPTCALPAFSVWPGCGRSWISGALNSTPS